ncbi:hypothetical protein L9F63_024342, partial [Diploptera punctata]
WCHIRFESEEIAKCAVKKLHNKKLENGRLIVLETKKFAINKPFTPTEKKNPHLCKIFIENIPVKATVEDIKLAFPGCKNIHILKTNIRESKAATVVFQNKEDLKNIMKSSIDFKVCGKDVTVTYKKLNLSAKSLVKRKQNPDVKSNRCKKISLKAKTESTDSPVSDNDMKNSNDTNDEEMDTKEMSEDSNDVESEDMQSEENMASRDTDSEINVKFNNELININEDDDCNNSESETDD